jgi:hypothetical protein
LVRVPQLKELKCAEGAPLCTLVGTDLFLLDQVGTDAQLANAVTVPEGFGATDAERAASQWNPLSQAAR